MPDLPPRRRCNAGHTIVRAGRSTIEPSCSSLKFVFLTSVSAVGDEARLLHPAYCRRKFAGFLGGADAPDVARQSHPGLRPLRTIAMPGTRLEIAELFVEHEVHAVIELDQMAIGIVVVDRHVVAGPVPYRSPEDLEFV